MYQRGHSGTHQCGCGEYPYCGRWTNFYGDDLSRMERVTVRLKIYKAIHWWRYQRPFCAWKRRRVKMDISTLPSEDLTKYLKR